MRKEKLKNFEVCRKFEYQGKIYIKAITPVNTHMNNIDLCYTMLNDLNDFGVYKFNKNLEVDLDWWKSSSNLNIKDLMQAYEDGASIQFRHRHENSQWNDVYIKKFQWNHEKYLYRIKPKTTIQF